MAGDWIKMRLNLASDPSVLRIAETVGVNRFDVVGRLHSIWAWADEQSVDGHAVSVTESFLDELVACPGFCSAMRKAGWLLGRDWSLTFPNFDRHNGETAKKRALDQKRKQKSRSCPPEKRTNCGPEKSREEKKTSPPSPPTVDSGGDAAESSEWEDLEAEVFSEGVGLAPDAVGSCQRHGCTADEVRKVLALYRDRKPAWEAGALYNRLVKLRPGQDADDFWPAVSGAVKRADEHKQTEQQSAKLAASRREHQEQRNREAAEADRREHQYGGELDSMTRPQVKQLIGEVYPEQKKFYLGRLPKRGSPTGVLRSMLLCHLESVAERAALVS